MEVPPTETTTETTQAPAPKAAAKPAAKAANARKNRADVATQKKGKGNYAISLAPIAGVRDFPPEEMAKRNWLFGHWREVARRFGFDEYDAPILEYEQLYKIKAGSSFEELMGQMYRFEDRAGQAVTLRPEMTPSLARMALHKGKALMLPVKWFSIPQCWRYEECTRGRKREHYQWNMDIIGVESISAEAELMATLVTFFQRVGLTHKDIQIKFSSRQVLQSILDKHQVPANKFAAACIIVDKLDKLERCDVIAQLKALDIDEKTSESIIDSLVVKNVADLGAIIGEDHKVLGELKTLMTLAEAYGYGEWLQFDASIVRGLAYYTGVVFEAFAITGDLKRAVCGGGRYDKLFSTYGGQDHPCCGFGFGDVVILELLADRKLLPKLQPSVNDIVVSMTEELRPAAVQVATKLRSAGRAVDIILKKSKMQQAYSYADRIGAERVILIAPDEWANGEVRIKNLRASTGRPLDKGEDSGNQFNVPFAQLLEHLAL